MPSISARANPQSPPRLGGGIASILNSYADGADKRAARAGVEEAEGRIGEMNPAKLAEMSAAELYSPDATTRANAYNRVVEAYVGATFESNIRTITANALAAYQTGAEEANLGDGAALTKLRADYDEAVAPVGAMLESDLLPAPQRAALAHLAKQRQTEGEAEISKISSRMARLNLQTSLRDERDGLVAGLTASASVSEIRRIQAELPALDERLSAVGVNYNSHADIARGDALANERVQEDIRGGVVSGEIMPTARDLDARAERDGVMPKYARMGAVNGVIDLLVRDLIESEEIDEEAAHANFARGAKEIRAKITRWRGEIGNEEATKLLARLNGVAAGENRRIVAHRRGERDKALREQEAELRRRQAERDRDRSRYEAQAAKDEQQNIVAESRARMLGINERGDVLSELAGQRAELDKAKTRAGLDPNDDTLAEWGDNRAQYSGALAGAFYAAGHEVEEVSGGYSINAQTFPEFVETNDAAGNHGEAVADAAKIAGKGRMSPAAMALSGRRDRLTEFGLAEVRRGEFVPADANGQPHANITDWKQDGVRLADFLRAQIFQVNGNFRAPLTKSDPLLRMLVASGAVDEKGVAYDQLIEPRASVAGFSAASPNPAALYNAAPWAQEEALALNQNDIRGNVGLYAARLLEAKTTTAEWSVAKMRENDPDLSAKYQRDRDFKGAAFFKYISEGRFPIRTGEFVSAEDIMKPGGYGFQIAAGRARLGGQTLGIDSGTAGRGAGAGRSAEKWRYDCGGERGGWRALRRAFGGGRGETCRPEPIRL